MLLPVSRCFHFLNYSKKQSFFNFAFWQCLSAVCRRSHRFDVFKHFQHEILNDFITIHSKTCLFTEPALLNRRWKLLWTFMTRKLYEKCQMTNCWNNFPPLLWSAIENTFFATQIRTSETFSWTLITRLQNHDCERFLDQIQFVARNFRFPRKIWLYWVN